MKMRKGRRMGMMMRAGVEMSLEGDEERNGAMMRMG